MSKYSREAGKFIGGKIHKLKEEGYPDRKQRIAIAISMARKKGLEVPPPPQKKSK